MHSIISTLFALFGAVFCGVASLYYREASRSHLCQTSWNTPLNEQEFDALFENHQMWIDIYTNLTQNEVTLILHPQGGNSRNKEQSLFSLKSPHGIFDCHPISAPAAEDTDSTSRKYGIKCFAYGFFLFRGVLYRSLFVHADELTVEYYRRNTNNELNMEHPRILVALETSFNVVFDMLVSTEKACAKFNKHYRNMESGISDNALVS
jgi:hypothetical protein